MPITFWFASTDSKGYVRYAADGGQLRTDDVLVAYRPEVNMWFHKSAFRGEPPRKLIVTVESE